jgi:sugar O-acyltransferase (sialic acid O-acetyltransferase NeuD family)
MKTNRKQIVIVGAGGHAECVAALIEEENQFEIVGMLDNVKKGQTMKYPILGGDEQLKLLRERNIEYAFVGAVLGDKVNTRVGIGIYNKITRAGFKIPNLVSSRALLRKTATVGEGLLVMPFAQIDVGTYIGNGVVVCPMTLIGHHCKVKDFVVFSGGVILNARLNIGEGAFIGMGATIFADIGNYAKVAPGTVVLREVPDNHIAFGNPMRIMKRPMTANDI